MRIDQGRRVAESTASVAHLLAEYGQRLKGCVNVQRPGQGPDSEGFILLDNGSVLAAAFSGQGIDLYQLDALERMMSLEAVGSEVRELTDDEIRRAIAAFPRAAIAGDGAAAADAPAARENAEFDRLLSVLTALPGVIASAFVADGFPVFQHGDADFEHIAAATEDMVRAGSRIAAELQLGPTDQIILETPTQKAIIAPISDMFLCVLARSDANLGLIRLNIQNMQSGQKV